MTEKGRSSIYAAWLDRQALPQPGGTYLIRAFFRTVFEIDGATKDRWVRFQVAYRRFAVICLVIFLIVAQGQPWALTWGLAAFAAVLIPVQYGGLFIVLRGAKRVSRDRWQGPLVIDRFGKHSPRYYLGWMVLSLLLDALFAWVAWAQWHKFDADTLWSFASAIALFTACAAVMFIGYRRTAPRAGSLE